MPRFQAYLPVRPQGRLLDYYRRSREARVTVLLAVFQGKSAVLCVGAEACYACGRQHNALMVLQAGRADVDRLEELRDRDRHAACLVCLRAWDTLRATCNFSVRKWGLGLRGI